MIRPVLMILFYICWRMYVRYANEMNLHESLDTIFQPSLGTMRKINLVHGSVSKSFILRLSMGN